MIGFQPGTSPLHGAHPYTPLSLAGAVFCFAFAARTPEQIGLLLAAAMILAIFGGVLLPATRAALLLGLPTFALLFLLHAVMGEAPMTGVGPLSVSDAGLERAVVLGGRIAAILYASVTVLTTVSPARLVDAMTARGVSFSVMYLLVSTLTLVPRMRERAGAILEAQQCRGLRLRGSPLARLRALGPLALPLVLGALSEVDEQVLALDTRGASASRRTALFPPDDSELEFLLRWLLLLAVIAVWAGRLREAVL